MKKDTFLKILVSIVLMLAVFIPFTNTSVEAASTQTGTIDISTGKLNVRNAANSKAKVIGSLKRNDKVTVYSQTKTGWTQIKYGKGKGYISSDYVRFYKTTSLRTVKSIYTNIYSNFSYVYSGMYTKNQGSSILSKSFTKQYIDALYKNHMNPESKDKNGNILYSGSATEPHGYIIETFDWKKEYAPSLPKYTYYAKNGKSYIDISQFFSDTMTGDYTYSIKLIKEGNSDWKMFGINRNYLD